MDVHKETFKHQMCRCRWVVITLQCVNKLTIYFIVDFKDYFNMPYVLVKCHIGECIL